MTVAPTGSPVAAVQPGVAAHPLQRLSADEIEAARTLFDRSGLVTPTTRLRRSAAAPATAAAIRPTPSMRGISQLLTASFSAAATSALSAGSPLFRPAPAAS